MNKPSFKTGREEVKIAAMIEEDINKNNLEAEKEGSRLKLPG